jgi:hypothetical protein
MAGSAVMAARDRIATERGGIGIASLETGAPIVAATEAPPVRMARIPQEVTRAATEVGVGAEVVILTADTHAVIETVITTEEVAAAAVDTIAPALRMAIATIEAATTAEIAIGTNVATADETTIETASVGRGAILPATAMAPSLHR